MPNAIGFSRLALLPIFLVSALRSGDGVATLPAVLFAVIAWSDYADGIAARLTGQYSKLGALLDPIVDRLAVLSGVLVAWHFELLPRWALVILATRELTTLVLARKALRHGIDIEVNWIGRIGVFLVFGGIFWTMIFDWWILEAGFVLGVIFTLLATVVYVRAARGRHPDEVTLHRHHPA